jgi:hypothetical protein
MYRKKTKTERQTVGWPTEKRRVKALSNDCDTVAYICTTRAGVFVIHTELSSFFQSCAFFYPMDLQPSGGFLNCATAMRCAIPPWSVRISWSEFSQECTFHFQSAFLSFLHCSLVEVLPVFISTQRAWPCTRLIQRPFIGLARTVHIHRIWPYIWLVVSLPKIPYVCGSGQP